MIVAVATQQEGFRSVLELAPAFAFHALFSLIGLQMVRAGRVPAAAEVPETE